MLIGLLGASALLLGTAGAMKLIAPEATMRALLATELPGARFFATAACIRLFGVAEVLVAAAALAVGGAAAAAMLALFYSFLGLMAWRLVRHAPGQDCGCFGPSERPASRWHIGVNAGCGVVALCSVVWPQRSLTGELFTAGASGVAMVAGVVALAWLGYLAMTVLPELLTLSAKVAASR